MRLPGSLGSSPRVLVTPNFHLLEAWYEPGAPPVPEELLFIDSIDDVIPPQPRAHFRLIFDGPAEDETLRKYPFVPPPEARLLFVPREAEPPWKFHEKPSLYLDIRWLESRAIYGDCDQKMIARVDDTEAMWSAFWAYKEFLVHSGELSDVKIDWLAERIIHQARATVIERSRGGRVSSPA
jgi:hypothetical protein